MNIFQLLLTLHLIGAAAFAATLAGVGVALLQSKSGWYARLATTVAGLTALELVTGIGMFLTVPGQEIISTCAKIGVYLALAAVAETALYLKKRQNTLANPSK